MLDPTTGTVRRRVTIGLMPTDMAIDARAGHVLIDNAARASAILVHGITTPLTSSPPESWWARTKRQVLTRLKAALPSWFPLTLTVPPAPVPPTKGAITTLDLARL